MEKGLGIGVDFQEDSGIQASGAVNLPLQAKVAQQQNITGPRTSQAQGSPGFAEAGPVCSCAKVETQEHEGFQ